MNVFIASNYSIIIKGLQDLLKNNRLTIYARQITYSKPAQIIREIKRISPQILILDLAFSKEPAENLIQQLKSHYPSLKIIVLMHDQKDIYSIINSGANAHILAEEINEELVRAIEFITKKEACYYSPIIVNLMASILHRNHYLVQKEGTKKAEDLNQILTQREQQIFSMREKNIPIKQIARHFKISPSTVYTHLTNIDRKLDQTDYLAT